MSVNRAVRFLTRCSSTSGLGGMSVRRAAANRHTVLGTFESPVVTDLELIRSGPDSLFPKTSRRMVATNAWN
jgi:hypothetical protein